MNHVSILQVNIAIALAVVAILMIAPLTFAQSTNYYNSMTPNPTANPSITNTIIPGASNIPTGNSTMVVAGVPNTGGVNSGTPKPGVPNTGGVQASTTPGAPNTGAGGESSTNLIMLALSAFVALAGITGLFAMRKI